MPDTQEEIPGKYGVPLKYEPDFRGPRKRRSCTDVLFLLLFTGFVVGSGFIGFWAFKIGDPDNILKPTDSNGLRCGKDSEVLSKPYLFFFDISKCAEPTVILNGCNTPQVCVEKCPDHGWQADSYLNRERTFDVNDVRNNIICLSEDVKSSVTTLSRLKEVVEQNLCARWYTTSYPSLNRCLPAQTLNFQEIEWLKKLFSADPMPLIVNASAHLTALAYSQEVGSEIFDDLSRTWKVILLSFGIAIVVSLIYISLLRWLAGLLTWLSILAVISLCITGTIFSHQRYTYLKKYGPPLITNKMIIGTLEEWSYSPQLWIVLAVFLGTAAVIIFLLVIFLRKRINVAITLIKEGSKAVSCIMTSLFFPIVPWIFQCAVAVWVLVVLCYLMSIGRDVFIVQGLGSQCVCRGPYENIQSGDKCDPVIFQQNCWDPRTSKNCTSAGCHFFKQEQENIVKYYEVINIFGFFWGTWFMSGLSQMILAGSFATWYWTFDKRNVPFFVITSSAARTIRYHLGTICFGSLIIAICSFIRAVIEYIEKKLKRFDNELVRCIFCCCKCFFWCLEKFLRFVNRNAYIMCALHGKNFCTSAGNAFNLLMRNAVRVVVLDKVTDFLFFIGKIVITGCMVASSYYLFFKSNHNLNLHFNGATPLIAIGIGCYIIASVFFGVYQMAVDTLFLCFLEDCERNDGTPQKPYFMSKNLMKILGKKNKRTD